MAVTSITGTYLGEDIFAFGYAMPDGYTYFMMRYMYRFRTEDTADPISYVEQSMDYYQSQRWSSVQGFEITVREFNADGVTGGNGSVAADANIEKAVQWAIGIANDDSHGYDQTNRNGPDYDCSSLVSHALIQAGFNVPVSSTRTLRANLVAVGFEWIPGLNNSGEMVRGDILLTEGSHTEFYIGQGQNVGAHYNEFGGIVGGRTGDQSGYEISVTSYYSFPWGGVLRWPDNV